MNLQKPRAYFIHSVPTNSSCCFSKLIWEHSGRRTTNPTGQNVKQCVLKLLSKTRDDPTVQSPGIVETARLRFAEKSSLTTTFLHYFENKLDDFWISNDQSNRSECEARCPEATVQKSRRSDGSISGNKRNGSAAFC